MRRFAFFPYPSPLMFVVLQDWIERGKVMKAKVWTYRIGVVTIMCMVFVLGSVAVAGSAGLTKNEIFIPPAAFTNDGGSPENLTIYWDYMLGEDTGCWVLAPIIFPKGAEKIRYVRVYAKDRNPTLATSFELWRTNMRTGAFRLLGSGSTSYSAEVQYYKIVPDKGAIMRHYTYAIRMHLNPSILVYGLKVRYSR